MKLTSRLNIALHFLVAAAFLWFVYCAWEIREGPTNETFTAGVFAGSVGVLALLLLVDAFYCIEARRKGKE